MAAINLPSLEHMLANRHYSPELMVMAWIKQPAGLDVMACDGQISTPHGTRGCVLGICRLQQDFPSCKRMRAS